MRATHEFFKLSVCDSRVDRMWRLLACQVRNKIFKNCTKYASHHMLFYAVYMCQNSSNYLRAFECYEQKRPLVLL